MKAGTVIGKNLKLLFRSKETAFTIIFGPLLIVLLVSAAYTGGDTDDSVFVGTYAPSYTPLADDIITAMKAEGYRVSVFSDEEECLDLIKIGQLHTCVLFPADFRLKENGTNEVTFAVDHSRINLVYRIIDGLSGRFGLQRSRLSAAMVDDLLARIALAEGTMAEQLVVADALDRTLGQVQGRLDQGKRDLGAVDVNVNFTDLLQIRGSVAGLDGLIRDIEQEGKDSLAAAREALEAVKRQCDNCSDELDALIVATIEELENATTMIGKISEEGPMRVAIVNQIIDDAAAAMAKVERSFGNLVTASEATQDGLAESAAKLGEATGALTGIRGQLRHTRSSLGASIGLTTEGVTAPLTTTIRPITATEDNLAFTYPYVLMLIIMFLGLMLNSTLIVMDKTSTAAFRNFTTATRDEYAILMSFVTTFLILLAQTLLVLLASYLFLGVSLFENFGVSIVIIFFAITLFSFLGMIIGYLSGTQEAAMIASLTLGSVLLFVSNLVLPLEAMNRLVQTLSVYNPYVVLSELLKQSMLFSLKLGYIPGKIGLLAGTILALFLVILAVQRSFRRSYFQRRSTDLAASAFTPHAKSAKPFSLGGREVRDLFDLVEALDAMTRAEFERAVTGETNPVASWVRQELKEKRLARKLDTQSKERMIIALEKHLKKQTRRLADG